MSEETSIPETSREQHYQQLDKQQRKLTRRYVILPFFLLILILIGIIGVMVSLRTPTQVAIVSDFLLTLFVLCPLVICLFPIVMLMFLLIVLVNGLHKGTKSPLRRIEQWTYTMEKRLESWAHLADSQVLKWAVRLAPIHNFLSIFDEPLSDNHEGGKADATGTEK